MSVDLVEDGHFVVVEYPDGEMELRQVSWGGITVKVSKLRTEDFVTLHEIRANIAAIANDSSTVTEALDALEDKIGPFDEVDHVIEQFFVEWRDRMLEDDR